MNIAPSEVALAYTYAWWLTGEDQAARDAVMVAVERPDVPGADAELRLEILLRRVRAAAIEEPTMCPASELALLHDGIGLGLDAAAGLTLIHVSDARTELAHGRLEALGADSSYDIVQPERLGGLAVGNPADIAAARQNPDLARLREMILTGRDELVTLSRVEVPPSLLEAIEERQAVIRQHLMDVVEDVQLQPKPLADGGAPAEAPGFVDDSADPDSADPDSPDEVEGDDDAVSGATVPVSGLPTALPAAAPTSTSLEKADDGEPTSEEVDLSDQVDDGPLPLGAPGRGVPWGWLLIGLAAIGLIVGIALTRGSDDVPVVETPTEPAAQTSPAETAEPAGPPSDPGSDAPGDPEPAEPTASEEEQPPGPPSAGLQVTGAAVAVGIGAEPRSDNPEASRFSPISVRVTYEGASAGDVLVVRWTVDGVPFLPDQEVRISPLQTAQSFALPVPADGWPAGQHILSLSAAGAVDEPLGEARFTVIADSPTEAGATEAGLAEGTPDEQDGA